MGKSDSLAEKQRFQKQDKGELTSKPFQKPLRSVRVAVGPPCLKCGKELDSRPAWSLQNTRGSRKVQRQGFLHEECLEAAEKETRERLNSEQVLGLRLPTFTEEELDAMIKAKGA